MVKSDLPLAFVTKNLKTYIGQFKQFFIRYLAAVFPMEGNPSQQQPVVRQLGVQKQQHQEHQSLSMSRACKPTPLKVSRER